jgi:phenylalanyl-tRNA synthetase alpha subunit
VEKTISIYNSINKTTKTFERRTKQKNKEVKMTHRSKIELNRNILAINIQLENNELSIDKVEILNETLTEIEKKFTDKVELECFYILVVLPKIDELRKAA